MKLTVEATPVALDPIETGKNRRLLILTLLLALFSVGFYYWQNGTLPSLWQEHVIPKVEVAHRIRYTKEVDRSRTPLFNIDDFVELFNLQKVTYRTYIGVLILPINAVLFYYNNIPQIIPLAIIGISLCISVYSYFISIKTYQNVIIGKLFYFILYLCALEIAPYYFLYYWITKGSA